MKRIQLFDKFLVETGLINPFLSNFRKFHILSFPVDRPGLGQLKGLDPMDYVSMAFHWRTSPEGLYFWYLVDVTWTGLLKGRLSFVAAKMRIKAVQNLAAGLSADAKTRIKVIQSLASELSR